MDIIYSSQAKEHLTYIDWRTRQDIINFFNNFSDLGFRTEAIQAVSDSLLNKVSIGEFVAVGKIANDAFTILSITKKQKIRAPE